MATAQLLLLILTTALWTQLSGSHTLDEGKVFEVVRPIRLHSLNKRDVQSKWPDAVKYAMTLQGKDLEFHLEKSDDLVTEDYTETYYTKNGTRVVTKPDLSDLCFYQGKIANDSSSMVSMSICDGLRGYFQTAEQRFLIEPMSEDNNGDHAVLKYENETSTPAVCGVTNTSWDPVEDVPRISKSRSRAFGPTMFQRPKYNELFLVADNRMYKKSDSDINKVRNRIFEIVNFVNAVYKPMNTFIAVIGLEIWSDADKIDVTAPAGQTLDRFTNWRNSDLMKRQKHDNAQLLTGIDFEGSTVGLAFIGTLCTIHSTGVIQDHNSRIIAVGATLAHEMGHNLGMNHDTSSCECSDASCIMTPALSYVIPKFFSSCSVAQYENYLNSKNPECLLNVPQAKALVQPAVCGNGFKEIGEDCDCGSVAECNNPCCNATSCRLTKDSQCADGACCQDCKIRDFSFVCREKVDECDLPEYCTGNSNVCPEDDFAVNGLPCQNGKGYCYNGQCPQREEQCIKMYGSGAVVARTFCYNYNLRGLNYGYCLRPSNEQYIPCQKQDVMCGKLFCEKGQSNPNYGRYVEINGCKASFYADKDSDFGQVDTGTKCGEEKVCSQNQCMTLEDVYGAINCSDKCQGHGVCNHKLECTCDLGWFPPDCQTGSYKGLTTGVKVGIIVGVCVLLGLILCAVGIIFFIKRRKSGQPQIRYPVQVKDPNVYDNEQRAPPSQPNTFISIHPKGRPPPPPVKPSAPSPRVKPSAPSPRVKPSAPPPALKPSAPPPAVKPSAPPLHTDFRAAQKALRPVPPPPRV